MIDPSALPRDQMQALRPRDIQFCLEGQGWVREDGAAGEPATYYHLPKLGSDAEILLPTRPEYADYAARMAELVAAVATLEDRPLADVLNDLTTPPGDVLRVRVISDESSLGNLPLDEGLRLLTGSREMLASAACHVARPQAFYPEKSYKGVAQFLASCRLGQTERGSFVAKIIAPVPPEVGPLPMNRDDPEFLATTDPFARKVTTRLMSGLGRIGDAMQSSRFDPIFDGIEAGVSANLCETLASIDPPGEHAQVEVRMAWSASRPRLYVPVPDRVRFGKSDFPIIREAGRRLRERAAPRWRRFVGQVYSLQAEPKSFFDDLIGKITIRTRVDGQPIRVKVVLPREDYIRACDAHRDEKRVAITGVIHHDAKIRVYELSEAGDLEVLDDGPDASDDTPAAD